MKRSYLKFFIFITCALLLMGCAGKKDSDPADKAETVEEDTEDTEEETDDPEEDDEDQDEETDGSEEEASDSDDNEVKKEHLSKSECEDEVEKLLQTESVSTDNDELLLEMANSVTHSWIYDNGVIFSEMDNELKERLRMKFFDLIFYGGPEIEKATAGDLDPSSGIPLEEVESIFKDAYGEDNFVLGEYEETKDGSLFPSFGAGDAIHVIEHMQIFEDDAHYLLSGPMICISDYEGDNFEGYADVLFEKNPDSRYGVTLLYGRYREGSVGISSVEASSTLPDSKDKSYAAENLIDGDYTTVWAEGASGIGVGETITIHLDKKQPVYGVQVTGGYTASYKQYSDNGVPTEFKADFGNGATAEGSLDEYYIDESAESEELAACSRTRIELDKPALTDTITITITGVTPGAKYEDTCASELWVY